MNKNFGQAVRYIFTGGMTTAVNYVIFFFLIIGEINYLVANGVAWIGAVLFAYFVNRKMVFRSVGAIRQEFTSFITLRLVTLFIENLCLWTCVDNLGLPPIPSKVVVSVITVILNYYVCRYHVFQERGISHE